MTRIWAFSDFQLTHRRARDVPLFKTKEIPDADLAIVAGDMFPPLEYSLQLLAPLAERMQVVYVPGNRDFYGASLESGLRKARKVADAHGIHLLYNETAVVRGVRVIGGTGWTDYAILGAPESALALAAEKMSDHFAISGEFTPQAALDEHRKFLAHLDESLAQPFAGPTVIATHHAPHANSIAPQFTGDPLTPSFVSDLSRYMEREGAPDLWIHGGIHQQFDYTVGTTRVVSNSFGYPFENDRFEDDFVVEVEGQVPSPTP